jgi:putative membrane protein
LPSPIAADLVVSWSLQPVALAAALAVSVWYGWSISRLQADGPDSVWPLRRMVSFSLGVALFLWTTNGFAQAYGKSLYWVWTSQQLALLLIVPVVLMAGQPIELARRTQGERALLVRVVSSSAGQLFANPFVGPVLIPALSIALFFGPVAGWAIGFPAFGWVLQVLIVAAGALIVLRLVSTDEQRGSMAIALALAVGVFELLLDNIPGIWLRLSPGLTTSYFDHRRNQAWAWTPLHDQQFAGGVLWCVSELIDLPFLALIFVRWLRADARDAADIDVMLEVERIAQGRATEEPARVDEPWWLTDPTMNGRYRR